mgnify:CR=1 FL=1
MMTSSICRIMFTKTRPQMSMVDRAAQFSPFAALTGYDAAIKETGRLTDEKVKSQ